MHAKDLDHKELLDLDPEGGIIRFAGRRAILLDAVALGLLRKYLVENFGFSAARTVLTQFGFAHGWRMAEAMEADFRLEDPGQWRQAGMRLHVLSGLFSLPDPEQDPLSRNGMAILASYEAEQHLLHFGKGDAPLCWSICGLISGFLSQVTHREIFVLEDRCLGMGDAACHLFGRTREEWGDERAEELRFFKADRLKECLDVSLSRVTETLKKAEKKLRHHARVLDQAATGLEDPVLGIVARSPAMRRVLDLARRVAAVDSTVLITGESGCGKERIARLVHESSPRCAGPFIAVNCGAVAESLLESELFGHARGSFTGATQDRPGLFEAANHGTLLLDEVGDISPAMQVKLLRAIQEREIRRVGENKVRRFDVRVVAATNKDLALAVAEGAFRQDLYYRLKVVELHVPPLRERAEDILPLGRVFLANSAIAMNRRISGFSTAVADHLLRYPWPGNVRELENAMERAAAMTLGGHVELEDLPEDVRSAVAPPTLIPGQVKPLEEVEREYILSALEVNGGNQTRTATQLNIGTATLYRKLKAYKEGTEGPGRPPAKLPPA
ncbi:MAG TPA: sigma-54-dependent Fis family transcriptional regulator [Holophaga sp.]|nr:sigma-54-dependent Fis family transcriptional regulator [Holophaga sp.]